jgi:hypothetical protein
MKNGKPHLSHRSKRRVELGRYIVADPEICHGQATFNVTRIMVWQVLDEVVDGRSWEFIYNKRWGGRIPQGRYSNWFGPFDCLREHLARRPQTG